MRIPSPTLKRKARIEIIPLIDIIFFLLATFVMVSLSMVKYQGIPVNLPRAATSVPDQEKILTVLTVAEGEEIYFNKEKIQKEELKTFLHKLKAENPDPKVLINGDGKASFDNAVFVLDEARKAGITKISIQTKRQEKQ